MKRSFFLALLALSLAAFFCTSAVAETKTPAPKKSASPSPKKSGKPTKTPKETDPQDDIVRAEPYPIDYVPQCQWGDVLRPLMEPTIKFIGLDIPVKIVDATIELTLEGAAVPLKYENKPLFADVKVGDKVFKLGITKTEPGWKYFNATLLRVRMNQFKIFGYDPDCDGDYFRPAKDGIIYPGSKCVLPFTGEKIWNEGFMVEFLNTPDGYQINDEEVKAPKDEKEGWNLINWLRVKAGLHPLELDAQLSGACRAHAGYINQNGGNAIGTPYVEEMGKPGYTPEGAKIASSSFSYYFANMADAVKVVTCSFYYRPFFVRGRTKRIGIGFAEPIAVFNTSLNDSQPIEYRYPIKFPGPEQIVPYTVFNDSAATVLPDPRPGAQGCGFPASLTFDWGEVSAISEGKMWIVDKDGSEKPIQVQVSAPNKPASPQAPDNYGIMAVMPLEQLKNKARYHVYIKYSVDGKEAVADWFFETE
ncbi:MAG: CAP domain-containing protein [Candidatus Brocadiia bacterium]